MNEKEGLRAINQGKEPFPGTGRAISSSGREGTICRYGRKEEIQARWVETKEQSTGPREKKIRRSICPVILQSIY
jgi:hypothetical protein